MGDYNHDGYSDLAFSTPYDASGRVASSLIVLLGGSAGLATSGSSIITNTADPEFLTAIDLPGSGNLDLVQGNSLDLGGGSAPADTLILLKETGFAITCRCLRQPVQDLPQIARLRRHFGITSGLPVTRQELGKLGFSIHRERSLSESVKIAGPNLLSRASTKTGNVERYNRLE